MLAVSLSSSPARCGRPPTPADAKLSFPGLGLGERDQLLHVAGGNVAGDNKHFGTVVTSVTGAKSFATS